MNLPKIASASLFALAAAAVIAAPLPAWAAKSVIDIKVLDTDNDGTVSLDEAKAAAAKKFDALDPDHDGKLDTKEAKGVMSKAMFKKADPDHDGTVDKAEYMSAVEAAFRKADKDNDGTLDEKEFSSAAGEALAKLIQ